MSGLFETYEGAFPLADIASIQNRPGTEGCAERYIVNKLSGRGTSQLFTWEYSDLMARPVQLTSAAPGAYLLRSYTDNEGCFLDALPILAWAICVDGQTRAVLPSGVNRARLDSYEPDFVRLPDSGIYELGHEAEPERFANEDAVREHLRSQFLKRRERENNERAELAARTAERQQETQP